MIKLFFVEYWNQTLLLLLFISYFIKKYFDYNLKKTEISYSIFQKNRLKILDEFYLNFSKAELFWNQVPFYKILNGELSTEEIDKLICPILDDLSKTKVSLQIYLTRDELLLFDKVEENIRNVNRKLQNLYFDSSTEKSIVSKHGEFAIYYSNIKKQNKNIIEQINSLVYEFYNKRTPFFSFLARKNRKQKKY